MNPSSIPTPTSELFDLSFMHIALKKRLSESIRISDIEKAFNEPTCAPEAAAEAITSIVFEPKEHYLEKAFLLRNLYGNSGDAQHPGAQNKIIRNLGYLLFAKELWFQQNPELTQGMFPNEEFNSMFFKKRTDQVYQFLKKNAPIKNHV